MAHITQQTHLQCGRLLNMLVLLQPQHVYASLPCFCGDATLTVVLHLNAKRLDGISCLCVALTCYVLRPAGGAVERAVPAEEHRDPIRGEAGWLVHSHVRFPALSG